MAKILLVEDHEQTRETARRHLEKNGHQVLPAGTLTAALEIVKKLPTLGVEVAILDGNLTPKDNSGHDGQTIAEAIRKVCPETIILTWSRSYYAWGDAFQLKSANYNELVSAVAKLLQLTPSGL